LKQGKRVVIDRALTHVSGVTVTAPERGEVSALNPQKNAQNIVDVLPADVITAPTPTWRTIGRLWRVSGRDEGEGKYVQVRARAAPCERVDQRLTYLLPEQRSPAELDAIPSDIVGSIESTDPSADQTAMRSAARSTSSPRFRATRSRGRWGTRRHTDLQDGRYVYQYSGTYSNRFRPEKKLGFVLGATYDWNDGIGDIEPGWASCNCPTAARPPCSTP
jgi:hypothetical protein